MSRGRLECGVVGSGSSGGGPGSAINTRIGLSWGVDLGGRWSEGEIEVVSESGRGFELLLLEDPFSAQFLERHKIGKQS